MDPITLGVIALIIGAVVGTAGGVVNVVSGVKESKETQADLQSEYLFQRDEFGRASNKLISDEEMALSNAELAWEQQTKNANEAADDLRYNAKNKKNEADDWLYQAATLKEDSLEYAQQSKTIGTKTTQDESILSTIYDQSIKDIQLTAEKNQLSNQIASVEQGKSTGSALAGMAKSGIRSGSSAHDALGNEQALYDKSMELTVKGQLNDLDSATINSYANLHNGLWTLRGQRSQQKNLLTQSKRASETADRYTRNANNALESAGRYEQKANSILSDYDTGGLAYRQYENILNSITGDYAYKKESMTAAYDRNVELLTDAYEDADYDFWDGVTDFFNGAQVGQAVGNNAASFSKNFGDYLK